MQTWSECSVTCGANGIQTRARTCYMTPEKKYRADSSHCGGEGDDSEEKECFFQDACIEGKHGLYSSILAKENLQN